MAPRSRRKASSPIEAAEPEEPEAPSTSLDFKQQLIGRPGRPIAVSELLKRLKALHAELSNIEQDDCPREDVTNVARELVHANVMGHKDKGVKAWSGCCIVEVFRLMAPDAPYTPTQLKDIFDLIVNTVIPALGTPSDPYNDQHIRILSSLDEVKSIVLLSDIPSADSFMVRLFGNSFDLLADSQRGDGEETLSKNVEYHLTSMLSTLVDECETLPAEVVELILAQFLRTNQGLGSLSRKAGRTESKSEPRLRELPPAYNLAKNVCNTCPERMARAVSQYFSTIVVDVADSAMNAKTKSSSKKRRRDEDSDDEESLSKSGPSTQDMKELAKAHKLLRELWRSSPLCIQNVIPQLEAELTAENIDIRVLAVETTGDLISGVGAAGLPESESLDPLAYPSQSLESSSKQHKVYDILTTPAAPQDFASVYPGAHSNFVSRKSDKSAQVRATFASATGRILLTSAGGIGIDREEAERLLKYMSEMLQDSDEKVRLAAVQVIATFSFEDIVQKLGPSGGAGEEDSVLNQLVWKVRDRKSTVRAEAMDLASKIWGVASGAIVEGNDHIQSLFGSIPSKIFESYYTNDLELNQLIYRGLFDNLLPLQYPPNKDKTGEKANGASQRVKDSQTSQASATSRIDPDALRAERILALARDLEPRAKTVFFVFQKSQVQYARYMEALLKSCEAYNGGVTNAEGAEVKGRLEKIIEGLSRRFPDPMTASEHLWKFAKKHDRRVYHLIRFAISPESDYKKVVNSIKEIKKRISDAAGNASAMLPTLIPLIQQSSVLVYNRSHVPTILKYSRREDTDLSGVAHEVLREISENHPEVFKAHVKSMCKSLVDHVPGPGTVLDDGTVQTLKSCAGFAQKYPSEMPQDREMLQAMTQYALYGNPAEAAKHAVTIIISNEQKKDMYVKEIVGKCVDNFSLETDNYMSRLAALSQIMLLAAPDLAEEEQDGITTIAIKDVLMSADLEPVEDDAEWKDELDNDTAAKIWALKILVNRQRGYADHAPGPEAEASLQETARPVYGLLQKILRQDGQISDRTAPAHQKSRIKVTAGLLLLKLSTASKALDHLLDPRGFNKLALMLQDPLTQVRKTFVNALKKYLGQGRLPNRFYAMTFLLAFEPTAEVKDSTSTWLSARAAAATKKKDNSMALALARLLSLLAHHPDFSMEVEHQKEFVHYILFYLKAVAKVDNLPLLYHVVQRCKGVQDGIDPENFNDRFYCLVDIASETMKAFADAHGWQIRAWTGEKTPMPAGIFAPIKGHQRAQEISEKQYIADEVVEDLEGQVRASLKSKKRKAEHTNGALRKKSKPNGTKAVKPAKSAKTKTPRKSKQFDESSPAVPSADRRRSSRKSNATSYAGMANDTDDEDEEMEDVADEAVGLEPVDKETADDVDDNEAPDAEEDGTPAPEVEDTPTKKSKKATTTKKQPLRGAGKKVTRGTTTRSTRSKKSVVEVSDNEEEDAEEEDEDEDE